MRRCGDSNVTDYHLHQGEFEVEKDFETEMPVVNETPLKCKLKKSLFSRHLHLSTSISTSVEKHTVNTHTHTLYRGGVQC